MQKATANIVQRWRQYKDNVPTRTTPPSSSYRKHLKGLYYLISLNIKVLYCSASTESISEMPTCHKDIYNKNSIDENNIPLVFVLYVFLSSTTTATITATTINMCKYSDENAKPQKP
uniref:Uncharacterized protein n=1 Tax=Glossina brevipalpis TaxID=37001 RepID=A0A1A9WNA6_9MUSC